MRSCLNINNPCIVFLKKALFSFLKRKDLVNPAAYHKKPCSVKFYFQMLIKIVLNGCKITFVAIMLVKFRRARFIGGLVYPFIMC